MANSCTVADFYRALADRLSGSLVQSKGNTVVTARLDDVDLWVEGSDCTIYFAYFSGMFTLHKAEIQQLTAATRNFFRVSFGTAFDTNTVLLNGDTLSIRFPASYSEVFPQLEAILDWLKKMCGLLHPWLLVVQPFCRNCGKQDAPQRVDPYVSGRYCDECFPVTRSLLERACAFAPQSIIPPPLSGENLDVAWLQAQSQRYQELYRRAPRVFWLEMIAWVALGQLTLKGPALTLVAWLLAAVLALAAVATRTNASPWVTEHVIPFLGGTLIPVGLLVLANWPSILYWIRGLRDETEDGPDGIVLTRPDSPRLFAWLDSICKRMNAPLIDEFYLTPDFNATASEKCVGRFRSRVTVITVGVPLVEEFTESELERVIAHELGHIKRGDLKFTWVSRTAAAWHEFASQQQDEAGFIVSVIFARWFLPRFLVRCRIVERAHEFGADRLVQTHCGPRATDGSELLKIEILGQMYAQNLIPALQLAALEARSADFDLSRDTLAYTRSKMSDRAWRRVLEDALCEPTDWHETHPSLAERLEHLGVPSGSADFRWTPDGDAIHLFENFSELREQALHKANGRLCLWAELARLRLPALKVLLSRLESPQSEPRVEERRNLERARIYEALMQLDLALDCYLAVLGEHEHNGSLSAMERQYIELCLSADCAERAADWLETRLATNPSVDLIYAAWSVHRFMGHTGASQDFARQLLAHPELGLAGRLRVQSWQALKRFD